MMIRDQIANLVETALEEAQRRQLLPPADVDDVAVQRPKNTEHGDFASSVALKLAKPMRANPMDIAETLASLIDPEGAVESVSATRPGFVNFALSQAWLAEQVDAIREAGEEYGNMDVGKGRRVQVEFVSSNPTGPMHVGHLRGAVIGSALSNVLAAAGYDVTREYYFNDAGNQVDAFNASLYARYLQAFGRDRELPEGGYPGEYLTDMAEEVKAEEGDRYLEMPEADAIAQLGETGLQKMMDAIKADLERLRVEFDVWFNERSLYSEGQYDRAMLLLGDKGLIAEREGATWFASTKLGDEDDKVLVRGTGAPTYFATDVAYHYNKFLERDFDTVIDVLGADHQGHVRFLAALAPALGVESDRLKIIINQIVTFKKGFEAMRFSKRADSIITASDLLDEVGVDACRYFFQSRAAQSQMEFDVQLAKEQSSENPVYYVQYAHARISSILRLAAERGIEYGEGDLSLLVHEAEMALVRKMLALPELIEMMADSLEPHHLPHYAIELATAFHWFYERCRVVSSIPEEIEITRARLKLVEAAKVVLARCLGLMLMDAPEEM